MIRNLKALGLAAFALLALGVMVAPAAQAEVTLTTGLTTPGKIPPVDHTAAAVHAVQINNPADPLTTHVFRLPKLNNAVNCSNANSTFTGTTTGTDKQLTIIPKYADCTTVTSTDTVGTPVTVNMNGCDYLFTQPETIVGTGEYTGLVSLVCPAGKSVIIDVYAGGTVTAHSIKLCTVTVAEKKDMSHVTYKNTPQTAPVKDDIDVDATVSGIHYVTSGTCGIITGEDATYDSHLTLTSTLHDVWLSD